ncbi:MAG: anaerobic ribonucleoside-triphosphate reductase [Candidatus Woesearchaeota archaeon]
MNCSVCSKPIGEKEGFVSNVNRQGVAVSDSEEPVVVCSESCGDVFQKSLPFNGKPVIHISRITGYYQVVENWNKGKQQEFFDRKRYSLSEL